MNLNKITIAGFILPFLLAVYAGNTRAFYNGIQPGLNDFAVTINEKSPEHSTVFRQGEDGYHTCRIPSIVQAKDGTLIAIVEGRRDSSHDPGGGHIDLVYKLSNDGGRSWSSLRIFEKSKEGWGASNPTSVVVNGIGRIIYGSTGVDPGTIRY